ncbi:hypothetical protein [Paenibacillus tianjinensis]|uniref:Aspartyl-phosphate phosphatase Spo0E family protein n=1 Tax=Paenibacillus tianjinensis TaxID=2810347 RepID=A0ABX7L811_9BACL|nr:hypothetical protein [Paenibacillus tianjinensis]QSF43481.1 hypothetical protein JRJ22_19650 [Paenibacillus tianjinensis]
MNTDNAKIRSMIAVQIRDLEALRDSAVAQSSPQRLMMVEAEIKGLQVRMERYT